jgi:ketosteroid isomerase-like protein
MTEDNDEILDLHWRFMRAVQSRDMIALEEMLGDDFTLTTGRRDAEVRTREQWLAVTEGHYRIDDFSFDEIIVQRYSRCAVVRSRYRQHGALGRHLRNSVFRMTDVWIQHEDGWKLHVRHAQPIEGN